MVGGYDDTAMGHDGGGAGQATRSSSNTWSPPPRPIQNACWYAKRARPTTEGGRHRDGDARPCWLAGKATLHTGKATYTYCTARPQPDEPAACGRGMAAVTFPRAAHPTWPISWLRGLDQGEAW
jgi:hypothetical protein